MSRRNWNESRIGKFTVRASLYHDGNTDFEIHMAEGAEERVQIGSGVLCRDGSLHAEFSRQDGALLRFVDKQDAVDFGRALLVVGDLVSIDENDMTLQQLCERYAVEAGPDFLRMGDIRESIPSWETLIGHDPGESITRLRYLMSTCAMEEGCTSGAEFAAGYELDLTAGTALFQKVLEARRVAQAVLGDRLDLFVQAGD